MSNTHSTAPLFGAGQPNLSIYEWRDRPLLGTTATTNPLNPNETTAGQDILLGGFSGLYFEGISETGTLRFITHTDRGPNGEPTDLIVPIPGNERPFALPNFQPELVRFELDRTANSITITERIKLSRPDGTPLTGLPNLQANSPGRPYTDEVPVDLFSNRLRNDPLGADLEGIVVAPDGTFWLVDEYRPAIYHFDQTGRLVNRFIPEGAPTSSSEFGTAALPAVYAQRRNNRGFEAVALEGNVLYAFIQSAIDNPDTANDMTSRNSRILRILAFDTSTKTTIGEYIYVLDDISGSGNARTDKIGDAVSLGNGKFLVVERDDRSTTEANKLIYEIDISSATRLPANQISGIKLALSENQEVPPLPDTPAEGSFNAILRGNVLEINGVYSNLSSAPRPVGPAADAEGNPQSAAHVHIGAVGANGGIVRALTLTDTGNGTGTIQGRFTLTAEELATVRAGNFYINLHTQNNPSGELRGQITLTQTIEQLSVDDLSNASIQPVSKRLIVNAAQLGYTGVEKLEGLARVDEQTIALINDNDFGLVPEPLTGDGTVPMNPIPTPVRLGLIEFNAPSFDRQTVTDVDYLGVVTFPTGLTFENTEVGGLSGLAYDRVNQIFYSISDDRGERSPARFYQLGINLSDGKLDEGDVTFQGVTPLRDVAGTPFPVNSLDPEGIVLTNLNTLYISSEGNVSQSIAPFVNSFSLNGNQITALPIPDKFLPNAEQTQGVRNNQAFESLTITPDNRYLYTATESALVQDGAIANLEDGTLVRILRYDLTTGQPDKEFLYETEPVAAESVPPEGFETNGLVELLALDNNGNFLALERSFAEGVGNSVKLFEVRLQNTTDVRSVSSVDGLEVDAIAQKRLLLDFSTLNIPIDNIEGMALGPKLPDGRQSLIVISDNNFSDTQTTQFIALSLQLDTLPAVSPRVETPPLDRINDAGEPDADDPAIYVNAADSSRSLVITALKDGGLAVYDLEGKEVQRILPETPVRYNNVNVVYGFNLNGVPTDLAIATDRRNDTLAIWAIDPTTLQLTDVTSPVISTPSATIFGFDDGSRTAYGLATYLSSASGRHFAFVSQREGDRVVQLELVDAGNGTVSATFVRELTVPIPPGGELEDAQVEGMVADQQLGYLYVGQEQRGIWKFKAEPDTNTTPTLVEAVQPEGEILFADVEGLTIYYGPNNTGYLLASSQGDSSFAVFNRQGENDYLGSFVIDDGVDGVAESDGADVINVGLGPNFPSGLLVVQDGSNEPAIVLTDDGEVQNFNTNFKFVAWQDVANSFTTPLIVDPISYNPRTPFGQPTTPIDPQPIV